MQLCTEGGDASKADGDWVAKVADFSHLYAERCAAPCSIPSRASVLIMQIDCASGDLACTFMQLYNLNCRMMQ